MRTAYRKAFRGAARKAGVGVQLISSIPNGAITTYDTTKVLVTKSGKIITIKT